MNVFNKNEVLEKCVGNLNISLGLYYLLFIDQIKCKKYLCNFLTTKYTISKHDIITITIWFLFFKCY